MLIWAILTLIFVINPNLSETFITLVLSIPIFLFIPGYVLMAVLLPNKFELEGIERLALSFSLSIASVPLLGLLLNFTFNTRLLTILLILCIFTILFIFIAVFRQARIPEDERFCVPFDLIHKIIMEEFNASKGKSEKVLAWILILSIVLAIGMMIFVITTPKIGEKFTEFYILGPKGKAEYYPTELKYGSNVDVLVGVVNHEYTRVNYTVKVVLDTEILNDNTFYLDHNTTWENYISFVPNKEGNEMELEFWLFKDDDFASPYRDLHLWVNVSQ
ncbi:MAG: DUF1616 domain-containing protein [Candidatus Methanoperedens sp.]|nr:DUF1616 domain-containing protein [Candidatus Methanoperedens sp.]